MARLAPLRTSQRLLVVRWFARLLAVAALAAAGVLAFAVVSGAWPSTPNLDREHVARSLSDAANLPGSPDEGSCRDVAPGRWRCEVADPGGSTAASYAVRATSEHCWAARRLKRADRAPARATGCVRGWSLSRLVD